MEGEWRGETAYILVIDDALGARGKCGQRAHGEDERRPDGCICFDGRGECLHNRPDGQFVRVQEHLVERTRDLVVDGLAVLVEAGCVPLSVSLISGDGLPVIDARLDEHGVLGGCDVGEEVRGASRGEQVAHRIALPVVGLGSVERHGDRVLWVPETLAVEAVLIKDLIPRCIVEEQDGSWGVDGAVVGHAAVGHIVVLALA